ncbi:MULTISPECIES: LytR/AlgR family response regulator transcription factor [Dyadobacter]|uniref:LytTR family two component transcriptional regulator n=2 Tax=Dyadobacter TaxID=120831 RepID=A0A2P8G358_9BACT|nr:MULTISPECIES: response regulator [Dyadobacter]HWV30807.1 response regulator [Dyadobacter sp.]MBZ1362813.1 response regulator [Dyadobacter fermentans]MDR6804151.1 two-component system LytT family response regulator [Dyadobacter fermentans]MDR7041891.1 two-component system LytT family response regulator [Dyadobacter sp. BE242]MDR7196294.1 two-component system LytT family response regulator [Dyadobacter sp. BE34]
MRTLIVDDERLARNELKRLLEPYTKIEIVGEAANAEEALKLIEEQQPELLFLDIQMPGKNGFELLSSIEGKSPEVIFTTAFDEYAIKAFEFNALDYLLKPIDTERLKETIHRIEENQAQPEAPTHANERAEKVLGENDQVFVKDGEKCWFVKLGKIRLFESMGNYVRLHFDDQKPLVLKSLNNLEERLDPNTYFRANRKHIINLHWIEKIEPWFSGGLLVTLQGGDKIEISRRQAIRFKELMSL